MRQYIVAHIPGKYTTFGSSWTGRVQVFVSVDGDTFRPVTREIDPIGHAALDRYGRNQLTDLSDALGKLRLCRATVQKENKQPDHNKKIEEYKVANKFREWARISLPPRTRVEIINNSIYTFCSGEDAEVGLICRRLPNHDGKCFSRDKCFDFTPKSY